MSKQKSTSPARSDLSWFDRLSPGRRDLLSLLVLYLLVLFLFNKIVFNNMVFSDAGDTAAALSWQHAMAHVEESQNVKPLWNPFIFSGMPVFASLLLPHNVSYIQQYVLQLPGRLLFLNGDMSWFVLQYFLAGIFMFIAARALGFGHLPALIAAVTFTLSPYAVGLTTVGHGSKYLALSYIPVLFVLTHAIFQRRDLLTFGLLAAAVGTLLLTNHVQMVFYGFLLVGLFFLYDVIGTIKDEPKRVVIPALLFVAALVLGFAISAYVYLPVQEYSTYSIRGSGESGVTGGLNYDYATNWSFHPFEMMNFLIPSFFGFETPYYWGWMPFNDASIYIGIVPIVLAVFAMVFRRNRMTWFLMGFSIVMLLIAFGRHLSIVYDVMFNYFPYFNKFRVPVMILHLMPFTIGLLAAYGFAALLDLRLRLMEAEIAVVQKRVVLALIIVGGLFVAGILFKGGLQSILSDFMFEKPGETHQLQQQYGGQAGQVLAQLKGFRFELFWKDYIKFAIIAAASVGLVLMYLRRKIAAGTFGLGLLLVLIVDLLIIDTKLIDPKPKGSIEQHLSPGPTARFLQSDTTLHRIFPLGELFQDNSWMYHELESVGGYSPAKIRIYQEMLDSSMYRGSDPQFPLNTGIVNMLNVKYLLAKGRLPENRYRLVNIDQQHGILTYENSDRLGGAFIVGNAAVVGSRADAFRRMNSPDWNPASTVILEEQLNVTVSASDSTRASIVTRTVHDIVIDAYASNPSVLVVSEVYYPAGWKAFVDGSETKIVRANSILRAVALPQGHHRVEFRFDPPTYELGFIVTHAAWGITSVIIVIGLLQLAAVRRKVGLKEDRRSNPTR
jgi:hypothetical protein